MRPVKYNNLTGRAVCSTMGFMQKEIDPTDHTQVCLMLDFYGDLLTDKSKAVLELYYQEDMSLSEIADSLTISRQGVHDKIRQGIRALDDYEHKLGLLERYLKQKTLAREAIAWLDRDDRDAARRAIQELERLL